MTRRLIGVSVIIPRMERRRHHEAVEGVSSVSNKLKIQYSSPLGGVNAIHVAVDSKVRWRRRDTLVNDSVRSSERQEPHP